MFYFLPRSGNETDNKAYHFFRTEVPNGKRAKGSSKSADTYGVDDVCLPGAPTDGPAPGVTAAVGEGVGPRVGVGVSVRVPDGVGVSVSVGVVDGVGVTDGVGRIQVIGSRPKISVAL